MNATYHIARKVFNSLATTGTLTLKPKGRKSKDIKAIIRDNQTKLRSTISDWTKPIYVVLAVPVPTSSVPLAARKDYASRLPSSTKFKKVPKTVRESQRCAGGSCQVSRDSVAVGIIDHSETPRKTKQTPIEKVDIDCKVIVYYSLNFNQTISGEKVQKMANDFGVTRLADESSRDLCYRVKSEIEKRMANNPRTK